MNGSPRAFVEVWVYAALHFSSSLTGRAHGEESTNDRFIYISAGLVWIAAVMVGSPMLFVQQLEVSGATKNADKGTESSHINGLIETTAS